MPHARRAAKSGGKGGLLLGIVIVVVLLGGAGVGGYAWNRHSAVATAEQYMDATTAVFRTGQFDTETLKRILVKDQAAQVDQAMAPISALLQGPAGRALSSIAVTYRIGEAQAGLKEATVNVAITATVLQRTFTRNMTVALAREGLAWKVDAKKTLSTGASEPAPQL